MFIKNVHFHKFRTLEKEKVEKEKQKSCSYLLSRKIQMEGNLN